MGVLKRDEFEICSGVCWKLKKLKIEFDEI